MEYVTIEEIDQAYRDCKRRKTSTGGFLEYSKNYIMENYRLYEELNSMTYEVGKSRCFVVTRPKLREVFCAQFRDRVVHHLLANKFTTILESEMTDSAFACRKGKGTDYGINYIKDAIERVSRNYQRETWVTKCDIEGFFMSIDRMMLYQRLESVLRRDYHGADIGWWLWLWGKVILNRPERNCIRVGDLSLWNDLPDNKSLFKSGGKGLPIGNLPSQILANLLLSPFDKMMIERLGDNGGYGRYVDDFVCISTDKALLLRLAHDAREYLSSIGLKMHPRKFYLQEAKKGLEIIGAVIKQRRIYVNNRSVNNMREVIEAWNRESEHSPDEVKRFVRRMNSHLGHLRHRRTYAIRRKAWKEIKDKSKVYCINMYKLKARKQL